MSKNIRILIIPDVHGRTFWREPVKFTLAATNANIIFLGDYHDPYPQEFNYDEDCESRSVDNFQEIIDLKKKFSDRVTLLIGNHDCGYAIGDNICSSRMDRIHRRQLEKMFDENRELFQLAKETYIADRHIIFSHAGILKGWVESVWGAEECSEPTFSVVDQLNQAWWEDQYGVLKALGDYDRYRGWGGYEYGSPVWSDIRSWVRVTPEETYGFNIVGHTQLEKDPIVFDTIADVDLRKAFFIDDQGRLCDYDSGEEVKKTEIPSEI